MTITITELQGLSFDNSVSDPRINPSSIPDSNWVISTLTSSQIVGNSQMQGHAIAITLNGTFNLKSISSIKTFADFTSVPYDEGNKISSQLFLFDGQIAGSIVSSVPIQADLFANAGISSIAAQLVYSGKELFVTSNSPSPGDRFYGYSGYAIYTDSHLYSSANQDHFVGGSGGINTLVLPSTKSNYTMKAYSFWDSNAQAMGSSSGWEISDNTNTYTTVDISGVQRIQFKDTALALDMSGNAGTVVKILGAVFGPATITNKQYVGLGLSLIDAGMSYAALMSLALNAKLGAGFTDTQEIQLLYQNLYAHTATINEIASIDAFITSGQQTQATLGVLAAETTNNAANINIVGLAQTGVMYTPA